MKRSLPLIVPTLMCGSVAFAQQAAAPQPQFEVASIKSADPQSRGTIFGLKPGGLITLRGTTLKFLIAQAYDVRDFQISGGPAWMSTERYDITAKPGDAASDAASDLSETTEQGRETAAELFRLRLQALLAGRFQLKLHHQTKERPFYALVVAKNGPKLKEDAGTEGKPPKGMMRMMPGQLVGYQIRLRMLVQNLALRLGRPVLDETGLKGTYNFELNFTPEQGPGGVFAPSGGPGPADGPTPALPPAPPGAPASFSKEPPPIDPNGPTIFTALQEQLGLKLESKKGPVEILVIDLAQKPDEN